MTRPLEPPAVSVIIAVYNGAGWVGGAVKSALSQTLPVEVIVVDDASTDETLSAVEAAGQGDPRLKVLRQPANAGPSAARNRALAEARALWIAPLDADDRMSPDRLERLHALAVQHGWDLVGDDLWRLSDWHRPDAARRHWRDTDIGVMELGFARFCRENLFTVCGSGRELGFLKPLMRRDFLVRHKLTYDPGMRLGEDFDLYARALLSGARFGLVDPQGYWAYETPGSLSKQHKAAVLEQVYRADKRLLANHPLTGEDRAALLAHMRLSLRKWVWVRMIEAVKARDPVTFAACWASPPHVWAELTTKLWAHFQAKSVRKPEGLEISNQGRM